MKEFKCKKMGYDCSWKHVARTEELLADIVAVHLRDVHGMEALTSETVGRIKNSFSNPSPVDAEIAEALTMKEFRCHDIGQNCTWRYIAQTEELIADGVAVHAREAHGIREFTPELMTKVKNTIHEWHG